MSIAEWLLLFLRVAHALAATVWVGGGIYYLLALRPAVRATGRPPDATIAAAQRSFGEWARTSTVVMVATGAVLMFDRLATDGEGVTYAVLLAAKILAAIGAFWLVSGQRRRRRRPGMSRSTAEVVLACGLVAYILGVALASVYARG